MSKRRLSLLDTIQLSDTENDHTARSLPVRTPGGMVLVGWAIRNDTVLVQASGVEANVRVILDGQDVLPIAVHESAAGWGADSAWPVTALELPLGTLTVGRERSVPGFGPASLPSDVQPAHVAFWCRLFPRIRGC